MLTILAQQIFVAKLFRTGNVVNLPGRLFMLGDAALVREMLEATPPNERARFFDFAVSETGLEVSVC